MNVQDAAYRTVHAYPGGSASLGPRMGISPAVLNSKVNPNTTTHRLALEEADEMIGITNDFQILYALAANHGFGLIKLGASQDQQTITHGVLDCNVATGELSKVIQQAISDGLITPNEERQIAEAGVNVQGVIVSLLSRIRASAQRPKAVA